jgi:hypothetical protein
MEAEQGPSLQLCRQGKGDPGRSHDLQYPGPWPEFPAALTLHPSQPDVTQKVTGFLFQRLGGL